MKKFKCVLIVLAVALWLTGCQVKFSVEEPNCSVENPDAESCAPSYDEEMDSPVKLSPYKDWNQIFPLFVKELTLSSYLYTGNRTVLLSDLQNRSSDNVDMLLIESLLTSSMMQQPVFKVVDQDDVIQGKQKIGISITDKLVSRSKTIALAKSLNADYVLFTTIYKMPTEEDDADVSLELLYTKTGEILRRVTTAQLIEKNKSLLRFSPLKRIPDQPKKIQLIPGI